MGNTFSREHSGDSVTLVVSGESITATGKHPFWVQGGHELDQRVIPDQAKLGESTTISSSWIAAEDLEPGDLLATPIGPIAIVSVVHAQTTLTVYNLHIPETQTYTVGNWGVWVHNDSDPLHKPCDGLAPKGEVGPSGRVSTRKYLDKNWDKATFGTKGKSIEYHVGKHGKGLSPVQYTQQALKAFRNPAAKTVKTVDLQGRPALKVDSPEGRGLFTPTGKIIWFHPIL